MAGLMAAPDVAVDGCTRNASCVAAAELTVTAAVWVMLTPPTVAETVFTWATVEASVPVVTPFASVAPGCTKLFLLPVDAVTVVGDATTLVWNVFTESGTENAVKISGDPTPVAWAV